MITLAKVRSKLPLIIMLAIGFLSTISMTIVLPVLPFIIQNHVHDAKNVALWVGVLETVFSACALFSGPVLGAYGSAREGMRGAIVENTFVGMYFFKKVYSVTIGQDSLRYEPVLENRADQVHRKFLANLFAGDNKAMTVMKLKDIAEQLEKAANAFEDVANTVESIAVKES